MRRVGHKEHVECAVVDVIPIAPVVAVMAIRVAIVDPSLVAMSRDAFAIDRREGPAKFVPHEAIPQR